MLAFFLTSFHLFPWNLSFFLHFSFFYSLIRFLFIRLSYPNPANIKGSKKKLNIKCVEASENEIVWLKRWGNRHWENGWNLERGKRAKITRNHFRCVRLWTYINLYACVFFSYFTDNMRIYTCLLTSLVYCDVCLFRFILYANIQT